MFAAREIELAKQMHESGLSWEPAAGHYVWDLHDNVERSSPFQEGVYFIINHAYFMNLLGGVDAFREQMVWLPTWEQARVIAGSLGMDGGKLAAFLAEHDAIQEGREREHLYRWIVAALSSSQP
ncbi:MAG: hypothetical protein AAF958_15320 [Planctomycetota bacterium]